MGNIIVTGSNRGIGRAVLERFAIQGWNIWAHGRESNEEFEAYISGLASKYHIWIKPVYFDLRDDMQIKRGMKEIFDDKEEIDVLVNNAGIGCYDTLQRIPVQKARELFDVNFFALYQITQLTLRKMVLQKRGAIINMSSIASLDVNEGDCVYGASKAAVNMLTKDLAAEVGRLGIRVNAVAPGPVFTDLLKDFHLKKIDPKLVADKSALGRIGEAEEIADVVYFLASKEAAYINGEVIRIDGGRK